MLDKQIQKYVNEWLHEPYDEDTRKEIKSLVDAGNERELYDRFYRDLEFGTGGLRGVMEAGRNRMNIYTVMNATQGLANYILANVPKDTKPSVAIAYDSRLNSPLFARKTSSVLAANGIDVHLFSELRPTPLLSFAVRHLSATAGIVITASHNPKEYNGYKVYWSDGGQVVPPHDVGIIDEVKKITSLEQVKMMAFDEARDAGKISLLGKDVDEAYFDAIRPLRLADEKIRDIAGSLRIVFSPIHGTGITLVPDALKDWGFNDVVICPEQAEPDGTFPTVESPNPEERAALTRAIELAREKDGDIVLATDPDCDRAAAAILNPEGDYEIITGNQLASLMLYYILTLLEERGEIDSSSIVIKTIVTSDLIAALSDGFGAKVEEVLTGFKYIGEKIKQYEEAEKSGKPSHTFIFGCEESYGYLYGTHARDKDAVISCCVAAETCAWAKSQGRSLHELLNQMYGRFGIFQESLENIVQKGAEGAKIISGIMKSLRSNPPDMIGDFPVAAVTDIAAGKKTDAKTGETLEALDLPRSNVLVFESDTGNKIVIRPSGTEPKIKCYFLFRDCNELPIPDDEIREKVAALQKLRDHVRDEFLDLVNTIIKSL